MGEGGRDGRTGGGIYGGCHPDTVKVLEGPPTLRTHNQNNIQPGGKGFRGALWVSLEASDGKSRAMQL